MSGEITTEKIIDASLAATKLAYDDAVKPAAKEVGKALETVVKTINVALSPIKGLVWSYEQFEDFLQEKVAVKLENTKKENIQTPRPNIAVPAIEALRYSGEIPELAELYAELLATSMDKTREKDAHPAFVRVIKELSPDEAKLLSMLMHCQSIPVLEIRQRAPLNDGSGEFHPSRFFVYQKYFSNLPFAVGCREPQNFPRYVDNLVRLGIFRLVEDHSLLADAYKGIYDSAEYREYLNRHKHLDIFDYKRKIDITDFGTQFLRVCIPRQGRVVAVDPAEQGVACNTDSQVG